jgi:ketosteroid isomerase-like protein
MSLLACAVPACAAPPQPQKVDATSQAGGQAEAAVEGFHSALRRGEARAALVFLAEDVVVFEEGRVERSKAEYALHHAEADAAFSKAVTSKRASRIARTSGDLAWVATESRMRGRFRGQDVDRIMVETMVLRRSAEGWRIVHIHWSSAQPATE